MVGAMKNFSRLNLSIEGHVAIVALNRPEKHNGIDKLLIDELISSAKIIKRNRAVRAVVLMGEGDSFCAGLDFEYVMKNPSIIPAYFLKMPWRKANRFQKVAQCWRDLPVPVIAALHGNCFGGGIQIALACDIRIAEPETVFSIMEMKWGLIPDMSGMVNLSRLTREDVAKELVYTGRKFSATEALVFGLVTKLSVTPFKTAVEMAQQISKQSPDAVSVSKQLLQSTWKKSERLTLFLERIHQLRVLGRYNNRLAMKNGVKKNAPESVFKDRKVN